MITALKRSYSNPHCPLRKQVQFSSHSLDHAFKDFNLLILPLTSQVEFICYSNTATWMNPGTRQQFLCITVHIWLDDWRHSEFTLAWIQTPPQHLKPLIANCEAEIIIQQLLTNQWHHVPTSSNPADMASKGMFPEELIHLELWWKGPPWLVKAPHLWPELQPHKLATVPEPLT